MSDKPTALHTLGLMLDPGVMRGAYLSLLRGKPSLERIFEVTLTEEEIASTDHVNPLYTRTEGGILKKLSEKCLVVTPLITSEVMTRDLEIKLKKEKDVDAVLAFQAEPLLPYSVEEGVVDSIKIGKTEDGWLLTMLAARKDHIARHLERWHHFQVEPEMVSCIPAALASFSSHFSPLEGLHLVVNLGTTSSTCVHVKEGKLLNAQYCRIGVAELLDAYAKDRDSDPELVRADFEALDFATIDEKAFPRLSAAIDNWKLLLTRITYALEKQAGEPVLDLLVAGEANHLKNISTVLFAKVETPQIAPKEDSQFPISPYQIQKYAIPIGMALSALPKAKNSINFRQEEFAYPHPWKRVKQPLMTYVGACLFIAMAIFLFGKAYISYEEDQIKAEYVDMLASTERPFAAFEVAFAKKTGGEGVFDPVDLTSDGVFERLQFLDNEISRIPDLFPLIPNVPTVGDVLAWLSSHPKVKGEPTDDPTLLPRLKLQKFSYKFVKRPEQKKKKDKYQVKVDLEFTSNVPRYAREFHDALLEPNALIDPKGEVKWSPSKGIYRTSFFLKDRTVYP